MVNSAVFLCSAFLQVNYQGLAGNYPAITQRSGELPVIYLTANNTKSRTRRELRNQTSWGTCKWKKNANSSRGAGIRPGLPAKDGHEDVPRSYPQFARGVTELSSPEGSFGSLRS